MIGATVRNAIFWGRDYLSGSTVRRHLRDIQRLSQDAALQSEHQARQLGRLLNHAAQTTPYFIQQRGRASLENFPVTNKNVIRESNNTILSTTFRGKRLRVAETSGSTGTPLRVVQDPNKRQRVVAEVIHANALIGYKVGTRYAWTIASGSLHRESRLGLFLKNKVELSQYTLDAETATKHCLTLQNDKNIEIIMGYPSVLSELAHHILEHHISPASFGVKGVLCLSEPLYPSMRETIREAFQCPVLSRYSNEECGVLAYECPTCSQLHLNTASYVFETLALDKDEATPMGVPGRIVITDLYNYALPMIRYDTGDIGSIVPSSCPQFAAPVLQSLEGRRIDALYDTAGHRVVAFAFDFIMERLGRLGKVKQFQIIQEEQKDFRLRICANTPLSSETEGDVLARLKAILGTDARIEIGYVDEIPVLNSGKRKYLINNYHPASRDT